MKLIINRIAIFFFCFNINYANAETKILFIGNSFTNGYGSAVQYYRTNSVTDLNKGSIGGVPALFKSFTKQAGLDYAVYLETQGGSALDFHLEKKLEVIKARPWDQVVMHGYSTLDSHKPGNPNLLIATTTKMSDFLNKLNPKVEIFLTSTWSRADLVYQDGNPWSNTPIEKMALDIRAGYNKAAKIAAVTSVNPVGETWTRAMILGIADTNPYNGIEFGKISLWSWDYYHASNYGYYLEALVIFGNLTGIDPRSLGKNECSGFELGMSQHEVSMLQQAAFEQLSRENKIKAASTTSNHSAYPSRCL